MALGANYCVIAIDTSCIVRQSGAIHEAVKLEPAEWNAGGCSLLGWLSDAIYTKCFVRLLRYGKIRLARQQPFVLCRYVAFAGSTNI